MEGDVPLSGLLSLVFVLLLLSAFFSGSETALMSLNRYQLRHKAREGHRGARLAERLLKRPDRVIGLILLGNNLVNFSMASLVGIITFQIGGEPAAALGTVVLTLIVLIFAETAPKTLAALHPERVAFPASFIYYPLLKITYPLVWLTNLCANGVLFLFGVRSGDAELQALSREELRTVVFEAGSRISTRYRSMLISILDLEKVTVDDVMVPHNEIVGIDLDADDEEIEKIVSQSEHTRLPVYRDTIDQVVGILHLRRLANLAYQDLTKATLQRLLDEPYFVPEGTPLSTQLVLEEIVGEFTTDPADDDDDVVSEGDDSFLVDATANIRELNRSQDWELPTEGPKTLNGLIVELLETIPQPNTCLKIEGYPIEIVDVDDTRVRTVRVGQRDEVASNRD